MSSTNSLSSMGSTIVEKRIYSLSTHGSAETISTASIKPSCKSAVPRVRLLVAPHMTPHVIPMQKIKTWESFQRTLIALFGVDIFNERMVRVTDHKGMPVISSCWSEFLEPNVTVIVDTCAYIPPSTPAINKALPFPPTTGYGNHRSLSGRRGRSRGSIKRSRRELDTVTLAGRESEDSAYEAACVLSPLGQIGQCAYFSPPNPLKSRPQGGAWDGWNAEEKRRETSVNMFVSGRAPPRNVQPVSPGGSQITNKPLQAHELPKIPFQGMGWSGSGMKRTATAESNSGAFQHKKRKSVWSKITSAFIHIFSGGSSADRNSNNFSCRGRGDPFQEDRFPENRQREHILSQAPDSMSASLGRRRPASAGPPSKDSVLPPLTLPPRMMHPNSLPFGFSTSLQRSKSLSYFPELDLSRSSPLRSLSQRTARHNPDLRKSPSPKLKPQIPPASSEPLRRRNISPPVPQRPTGSFGFNPQYEKPTTIHMAQIMEIASDQQDDGRCRTGSADTDKTLVDFPQKKPLPTIPHMFPSPVPQPLSPALPEADRRPPTTTPLIVRTSSYGKRFASVNM